MRILTPALFLLVACKTAAPEAAAPVASLAELYVETDSDPQLVPIGEIRRDPGAFQDTALSGRVIVESTLTQRGFWFVDNAGERLFAMVRDLPEIANIDIDHGQELALRNARVLVPDDLDADLAPNDETRATALTEPAFLLLGEDDVTVVEKYPLYDVE